MHLIYHSQFLISLVIISSAACRIVYEYVLYFQMNQKKKFRYPLKHLFLTDRNNYEDLLKLIEPFSILPMSDVVIACFEDSSAILYQPYKIGENTSLSKYI